MKNAESEIKEEEKRDGGKQPCIAGLIKRTRDLQDYMQLSSTALDAALGREADEK